MRLKSWEDVTFEISELGIFGFYVAREMLKYTSKSISYAKELTSVPTCSSQGDGFNTPCLDYCLILYT